MRDETKMAAKETNYSLSQNCWDIFVSSRLLSVDVHDLVTESQAKGGGGREWKHEKGKNNVCFKCPNHFCLGL